MRALSPCSRRSENPAVAVQAPVQVLEVQAGERCESAVLVAGGAVGMVAVGVMAVAADRLVHLAQHCVVQSQGLAGFALVNVRASQQLDDLEASALGFQESREATADNPIPTGPKKASQS